MSAYKQYKKVTLGKDARFLLEQKDGSGNIVVDSGSFDTRPTYSLLETSDHVYAGGMSEFGNQGKFTGLDSATLSIRDTFYLMIKQP